MDVQAALTAVREKLAALNTYVDEHHTADDLEALNAKYVPSDLQGEVATAIKTVDDLISNLAGQDTSGQ